ncbi:MAG: hypothetical protein HY261_02875 [Chloroflexi bacterium]|nr:hypothetical protein [Chloroflexota bacterium]
MSLSSGEVALLGSAIVLGLRHGVDYDHIAAITDITGIQRTSRQGMLNSTFYAIGHGAIVMLLIGLAVAIGAEAPSWVDAWTGRLVGMTLLVLGLVVLRTAITSKDATRIPSRGMLILRGFRAARRAIFPEHRHAHTHTDGDSHGHQHTHGHHDAAANGYGPMSAFGVGIIHGISAETPSQILLFVLAAGFTSAAFGLLVGAVFVSSILLTNTGMSVILAMGSTARTRRPWVFRSLATVSAAYSVIVGVIFVGGLDSHLPHLL